MVLQSWFVPEPKLTDHFWGFPNLFTKNNKITVFFYPGSIYFPFWKSTSFDNSLTSRVSLVRFSFFTVLPISNWLANRFDRKSRLDWNYFFDWLFAANRKKQIHSIFKQTIIKSFFHRLKRFNSNRLWLNQLGFFHRSNRLLNRKNIWIWHPIVFTPYLNFLKFSRVFSPRYPSWKVDVQGILKIERPEKTCLADDEKNGFWFKKTVRL